MTAHCGRALAAQGVTAWWWAKQRSGMKRASAVSQFGCGTLVEPFAFETARDNRVIDGGRSGRGDGLGGGGNSSSSRRAQPNTTRKTHPAHCCTLACVPHSYSFCHITVADLPPCPSKAKRFRTRKLRLARPTLVWQVAPEAPVACCSRW